MLTKPVKIDQSEGIPEPGMEQPFVKFAHRHYFASSLYFFSFFFAMFFVFTPTKTERMEEAKKQICGQCLLTKKDVVTILF